MPELPEVEATRHLTGRMLTAARRRGKLIRPRVTSSTALRHWFSQYSP
jgi:hypothetical protein